MSVGKKVVLASFEVLSWHLPEGTKQNHSSISTQMVGGS